MPTNVTPEYKKAEEAFRAAREPRDRLDCLKEMLRTIPKHKGTEHLQADIKSRIKQLTEELAGPRKGGKRSGPSYAVRPEGAAQVAMIGPPNSGKSAIHRALTHSQTDVGAWPFTTQLPVPGMLPFEDIHFQLVDLPPLAEAFSVPWYSTPLQTADAALLVVDLAEPACAEQLQYVLDWLRQRKVCLRPEWPGLEETRPADTDPGGEGDDDPFRIDLPALLVANKCDLDPAPGEVEALQELLDIRFPAIRTSVESGEGMTDIGEFLYRGLNVVRVYTKVPGKPPDADRPFTLFRGATIHDVARLVHKDVAGSLRFARIWGAQVYDGQQVGPDHEVEDRDVIELHMA
jgi:ribosome-interacting GTPase 1